MTLRTEALRQIDREEQALKSRFRACQDVVAESLGKLRSAVIAADSDDATVLTDVFAQTIVPSRLQGTELDEAIQQGRIAAWGRALSLLVTDKHIRTLPTSSISDWDTGGSAPTDPGILRRKRVERAFEDAEKFKQFIILASQLGESAFVDVLVAGHIIDPEDRQYAVRFIADYLGEKSRVPVPEKTGIWCILGCGDLLKDASVKQVINHHIRKAVYQELLRGGGDDIKKASQIRREAGDRAMKFIAGLADQAKVTVDKPLRDYFSEVETFFRRAAAVTLPETMRKTVPHEGVNYPLPSWRQRMALVEIEDARHGYVGYEPGDGKTFVPVANHERKKAEWKEKDKPCRTLYIGPKNVLDQIPNRLRPGTTKDTTEVTPYYKDPEKDAPTIGIIKEKMSEEEIEEEMQKEFVFCPYSMLMVTLKSGIKVYQKLRKEGDGQSHWSQVVFDEAHYLQGDAAWTKAARDIIHGHAGLYEEGNVLLMSGTPAIGELKGVSIQMALLEPEAKTAEIGTGAYRKRGQHKKLSTAKTRMGILRHMFRYDPPKEWLGLVKPFEYDLSTEEKTFLRLIANDQTLTKPEKLHKMLLFIRCPQLVSGQSAMPSTLLGWVETKLEEDLEEKETVLIAEHMRSQAVLRHTDAADDPASEEDLYFYARIGKFLEQWKGKEEGRDYRFHVIHGGTKTDARRQAYADAAEAKKNKNFKCVIIAHSECVNVGIDLRSIQRIASLEWPWSSQPLLQLLMRSWRAHNEDIEMLAYIARKCVEQGIKVSAQNKFADARKGVDGELYCGDEAYALLQEAEDTDDPLVASYISSPEQHALLDEFHLHNAGPQKVMDHWNRKMDTYRQRITQGMKGPESNRNRALASYMQAWGCTGSILHTNSQGFALPRILRRMDPQWTGEITCMEPTQEMVNAAGAIVDARDLPHRRLAGTPADLIKLQNGKSGGLHLPAQDCVVLEGLEQMHFRRSEEGTLQRCTRVESLIGAVRATKLGGRVVIPLPREACTKTEFDCFCGILRKFGLEVDKGWTDIVKSRDNAGDAAFEMFVVNAVKVEEPKEEDMATADQEGFAWTHHERLEGPERSERSRLENAKLSRRLPFGLVHGSFSLRSKKLKDVPTNDTLREKQIEHLHRLEKAVAAVRCLAKGPEKWTGKGSSDLTHAHETRSTLDSEGIKFLPHMSGKKNTRPAFQLKDYPDHLFFPYDPQWKEDATTA